ncbi:MAG: formate dehydrogenase subunit gamma [Betaproteobacteria bacterium]|nr:formate dehydrogenase subunit gamma [Betaproteobacteria bacterium]
MPEDLNVLIDAAIDRHKSVPGGLLPLLHDIQDRVGYVPETAVPAIAAALNLSRAEVHGVISFYHHFRSNPAGRHVVQVCRAEACQSVGAEDTLESLREALGIDLHQTTKDGAFTLEPIYCLGNCACGPSVMIDGELRGRVAAGAVSALLSEVGGRP